MKKLLTRIARSVETLAHAVGDAAQGPIGTRELETPGHVVQEKTKKEQVFEWLSQREEYVKDAYHHRRQDMADVVRESIADARRRLTPDEVALLEGPHEFVWDDARGEFVPKES